VGASLSILRLHTSGQGEKGIVLGRDKEEEKRKLMRRERKEEEPKGKRRGAGTEWFETDLGRQQKDIICYYIW